MDYKIEKKDKAVKVLFLKDLDHHMAELVRISIDRYLEDTTVSKLVLDFAAVNFMDSSGIGLIMGRYKMLSARGGSIEVINTNGAINRILSISGLYKIVEMKGEKD